MKKTIPPVFTYLLPRLCDIQLAFMDSRLNVDASLLCLGRYLPGFSCESGKPCLLEIDDRRIECRKVEVDLEVTEQAH